MSIAASTPSPSGYGWTTDELHPFFPGTKCIHCGRFVGRDGLFEVEYFEMSETIASVEAEHPECVARFEEQLRGRAV